MSPLMRLWRSRTGRHSRTTIDTRRGQVLYAAGEDRAGVAQAIIAHHQNSGLSETGIGIWQGISLADSATSSICSHSGSDTISSSTTRYRAQRPVWTRTQTATWRRLSSAHISFRAMWRCFVLIVSHTGKDAAKACVAHPRLSPTWTRVLKVTRPGAARSVSLTVEKQKSGREDIAVDFRLKEIEVVEPNTGEVAGDLMVVPTAASASMSVPSRSLRRAGHHGKSRVSACN